jgi:hypothetical protein
MVNIDKKALTAEQRTLEFREGLAVLVLEVAKVRPLFDFVLDKDCLTKDWNRHKENGVGGGTGGYDEKVYRVKVYQDGEQLGALHTTTRYARNVGNELVYGVESFRINKERGNSNTTYSKDMKVALRSVKKSMVARANNELIHHIKNNVATGLQELYHMVMGGVRYSINMQQEAMGYAMKAYEAHLKGATEVTMPVKLVSVGDLDEHHRRMEKVMSLTKLTMMYESKTGYCIHVQPDEKIVCYSLAEDVVRKYASFDELPKEVAEKFAMFKIIPENDAYEHLGVKLKNDMFFIVQ